MRSDGDNESRTLRAAKDPHRCRGSPRWGASFDRAPQPEVVSSKRPAAVVSAWHAPAMSTILVKLRDGQEFEYKDAPQNGGQYFELFDETYSYDVVTVLPSRVRGGGPDQRMTVRQFPKHNVADIRRL